MRKHVPAGQRGERIEINECSPNELLNDPVVGLVMMSDGVDRQILELFDPGGVGVTAIDFRTDPVTARRRRVVSLVTHADIPAIVWADASRSSWSWPGQSGSSPREGDDVRSRQRRTWGEDRRLPTHARLRAFLVENVAKRQIPITHQELAKAVQILPPHSIHQVTETLEHLMEEDAAASPRSPSAKRVAACRRPGFSTALDVSAGSRAIRTVGTQGHFTPLS